ncbi:hypothetical protein F4W66_24620 (plasmid) [Escherichia coli]|nr:hypothetical protein F4W66_24620 [Escherichia coli]
MPDRYNQTEKLFDVISIRSITGASTAHLAFDLSQSFNFSGVFPARLLPNERYRKLEIDRASVMCLP